VALVSGTGPYDPNARRATQLYRRGPEHLHDALVGTDHLSAPRWSLVRAVCAENIVEYWPGMTSASKADKPDF